MLQLEVITATVLQFTSESSLLIFYVVPLASHFTQQRLNRLAVIELRLQNSTSSIPSGNEGTARGPANFEQRSCDRARPFLTLSTRSEMQLGPHTSQSTISLSHTLVVCLAKRALSRSAIKRSVLNSGHEKLGNTVQNRFRVEQRIQNSLTLLSGGKLKQFVILK